MSVWDTYQHRIDAHGGSVRGSSLVRETRMIGMKLPNNLSYFTVDVFSQAYGFNIESEDAVSHMVQQNVAIIDSDNLNEKMIYSMPSEDIELGALIHWMDNYWLVIERDANSNVYTRGKLLQCNHLLRWLSPDNKIMEQWCVIEDGTKYLTGEYEDREFVVTRGDSRISMQIARNEHTVKFNRERRFLIDDPDSPHKLAYLLTKPLKSGLTYNNSGTFKFVLQEVVSTEYDNHELGIADYYLAFPKSNPEENIPPVEERPPEDRKKWI